MPKETFGGDDDEEGLAEEKKKKLGLGKFELSPDANIRDLFWKIMGSYAAAKKPGVDLHPLEHDRFALMRVAVSVLSNPESGHYGLTPRFIAGYSMMMMLDAGWLDAFAEFLGVSLEKRLGIRAHVMAMLKRMVSQDRYKDALIGQLGLMLRKSETTAIALEHIAEISEPELSKALKKELMIFARGDVGQNQHNAMRAISMLMGDAEVRKSFIILLSHWDGDARMAAALALKGSDEADVKAAAKKRLELEPDDGIKKILKRIAK